MGKDQYLKETVEHIDIKGVNVVPLVDQMARTAFQARNLARAARIYDAMIADRECGIILTLAGSLISAGLKRVILDLMENNMVDAIVSTGANIVDQDFFEGLGFRHYVGTPFVSDNELRELHIDRIYDTFIDEDELRICDETTRGLADRLEARPYTSREFIAEMGRYLAEKHPAAESIVLEAWRRDLPIFCPAFSDCSAGFGLVAHQVERINRGEPYLSIDSAGDFRELTQIKIAAGTTGLFMLGGGVPKNFVQDIVVSAEFLGYDVAMHKYAVQLTVADERDGALSGSTLREANSWGKVDLAEEQMVFGELTITFPLIAGYAYHRQSWKDRAPRRFSKLFEQPIALRSIGYDHAS